MNRRTHATCTHDRSPQEKSTSTVASDTAAIQSHYDLPVQFFASFLGPRMAYSCAYFTDRDNSLAQAEEDKLRLTAQKLELEPGDRVLDIGCGWGSFLFFAAEEYGCTATGITLSREQVDHVNRTAAERGLAGRVKAELVHVYEMDYPKDTFNKVVTIGAIEHIEDLELTFRKTHDVMTHDGLFMCHGMTQPWSSRLRSMAMQVDETFEIVRKHFGVGHWKSFWEVARALEQSGFEVLDHENITPHYALTCTRWIENLSAKENEVAGVIIDDEKYREFVALMAGYVSNFESDGTICNQILCQKQMVRQPRPLRPLTRRHMLVDESAASTTADRADEVREAFPIRHRGRWGLRRRGPAREGPEPPIPPSPQEASRAGDPELRELFETRLPAAIDSNREIAQQINGIVTMALTGDGGCTYSVVPRRDGGSEVVPGDCIDAGCRVQMDAAEFKDLLARGSVGDWLDAFKARRIHFEGDLVSVMRLRGVVTQLAADVKPVSRPFRKTA